MGNVLAGFLVRLGFEYDKDGLKKFEGTVNNVGKGMMSLAKRGVAAGVAITAAIAKANSEVNKLYTLSNQTGASVHSIRVLGSAFSAVGGSVDDLQGAISSLAQNIKYGNFEPYLNSLGVSLRDAQGNARDTSDVLLDLRDVLVSMPQEQARPLAEALGIGGSAFEAMMKSDFNAELARSNELFGEMNQIIGNSSLSSHRLTNEFSRFVDIMKTGSLAVGASLADLLNLDDVLAGINNSLAQGTVDFIKWQRSVIENSNGVLDWAEQTLKPATDAYKDTITKKRTVDDLRRFSEWFVDTFVPDSQKHQTVNNAQDAQTVHDSRLLGTRGMRNNNPGNLRSGYGQVGTDSGGYAVFPTREAGYNAAARQLVGYHNAGLDTINAIVSKWAPASENDTQAYIASVVESMNRKGFDVGAFSRLNLRDSGLLKALLDSMINHEVGSGAESYFTGSAYDTIIQKQAQNDWTSRVVTNNDRSRNVNVSQNITIYASNPEEVRRVIDPMNTAQYATNNAF